MIGLTPRQAQALNYIRTYMAANGGAGPTYEQIADHMGFASKSRAWRLVDELVKRGHIRRSEKHKSGLEVVGVEPPAKLARMTDAALSALMLDVVAEVAQRARAA